MKLHKSKINTWAKAGLLALSFSALSTLNVSAQQTASVDANKVYTAVEHAAEFPGGMKAFYEYLAKNIKYPEAAKKNEVSGKVFLTFVVERDGDINDIKVLRGIGSGCDEEAVRVMNASPKWNPGTQNGVEVRQQYTVPISFTTPAAKSAIAATGHQDANQIYTRVDESATFPGGLEKFYDYLAHSLRYPAEARTKNVQGKVFVTFVVEKDGSLTDVKVMRGIGSGCDEESARVLKASPKWNPGKQNGKVVRQQYTVPISFTLTK